MLKRAAFLLCVLAAVVVLGPSPTPYRSGDSVFAAAQKEELRESSQLCPLGSAAGQSVGFVVVNNPPGKLLLHTVLLSADPGSYWVFLTFCDLKSGFSVGRMTVDEHGAAPFHATVDLPQLLLGTHEIAITLSGDPPVGPPEYGTGLIGVDLR